VDFGTTKMDWEADCGFWHNKNGLIFIFVGITSIISVGCIRTYINVGAWHIYWYSFLLIYIIIVGCVVQAAALESLESFLLGVKFRKL
jgi:hypothetical protein